MVQTVPTSFMCREHSTELTEAVLIKVEAERMRTANSGFRVGGRRSRRPFRVLVDCPGGDGHQLVFAGSYEK